MQSPRTLVHYTMMKDETPSSPKILLVGGGSGGHIMPFRGVVDHLVPAGADVHLCTGGSDFEAEIVNKDFDDVTHHALHTGKIRYYISRKNLSDMWQILRGITQAKVLLRTLRPDVIFFKGGFVCFPILVANIMSRRRVPMVLHESDTSVSVFGRVLSFFSVRVYRNFDISDPAPLYFVPSAPLQTLPQPYTMPNGTLPLLLVFGGSQGADFFRRLLSKHLTALTKTHRVVFIYGKNKPLDAQSEHLVQYGYIPASVLSYYITQSSVVISRGSANAMSEIIVAKKPSIIIPLPGSARNHQTHNAKFFARQNLCLYVQQKNALNMDLLTTLDQVMSNTTMNTAIQKHHMQHAGQRIAHDLITLAAS